MMRELPIYSRAGEKENQKNGIAKFRCGELPGEKSGEPRCRWHEEHELLLVDEGSFLCTINGETALVQKGGGIWIPSGQLHMVKPGQEGAVFRQMKIMPRGNAKQQPEEAFLLLAEEEPEKKKILEDAKALFQHAEQGRVEEEELSRLLQRICTAGAKQQENGDWESLRRMTGYIQTHFGQRIKLPDIAAAGMVCRSKCCGLFRDYLKTTPIEYLNACRLEKAKTLLAQEGLSVAEIAQRCGFDGSSYFAQCYRRCYGESPRDTKKRKEPAPGGLDG